MLEAGLRLLESAVWVRLVSRDTNNAFDKGATWILWLYDEFQQLKPIIQGPWSGRLKRRGSDALSRPPWDRLSSIRQDIHGNIAIYDSSWISWPAECFYCGMAPPSCRNWTHDASIAAERTFRSMQSRYFPARNARNRTCFDANIPAVAGKRSILLITCRRSFPGSGPCPARAAVMRQTSAHGCMGHAMINNICCRTTLRQCTIKMGCIHHHSHRGWPL